MVTAEHTTPGKRIGRRAAEKKEPQTQGQRFPMPEKRSNKVLDNWREPRLIRFIRLDTTDLAEVYTYRLLVGILNVAIPPTTLEEVQQQIDARLQERKKKERERLWDELLPGMAETMSRAQDMAQKILRMLAQARIDEEIVNEFNTVLRELQPKPFIRLKRGADEPVTVGLSLLEEGMDDTGDILDIFVRGAAMGEWYELMNLLPRHGHLYEHPGGHTSYVLCPTCDRVFERTRKDRSFCYRQCLDSFRTKKFSKSPFSEA